VGGVESGSVELRVLGPDLAGGGRLMRLVARWGLAITVSAGAFALTWWACQEQARLDEGAALGVAGAALAVVLAVAGWWAGRERPDGAGSAVPPRVVQKARGGRDVNVAGRDQTIINYRRRDE
jgi:hypothetical protein